MNPVFEGTSAPPAAHAVASAGVSERQLKHPRGRSTYWVRSTILVWTVLIVALQAALLFAVMPRLSARLSPSYNQERAADGYDLLAANLAAGHGYRFYPDTAPTTMREPGYPLLLAGLLRLSGNRFYVVKLSNLLFALTTAWLLALLVWRMTDRRWPGFMAALLFLFHPGTLIAETRAGIEIPFGLLLVCVLLTVLRALERTHWSGYAISGLVLGVTVLFRSVPLLFPVALLAYLLVAERPRLSILAAWRNIAVMVVTMLLVLSPWIVRNYRLTGRFLPTASVVGISAQAGEYICTHLATGRPWWLLDREAARERSHLATRLGYPFEDGYDGYYQTFYRTNDEIAFSQYLFARVASDYRSQPRLFAQVLRSNLFNFWFAGKTPSATTANVLLQVPYLLLALAGAIVGIGYGHRRVVLPTLLLVVYVFAISTPILAQARYSIPLVPALAGLGALALAAVGRCILRVSPATGLRRAEPAAAQHSQAPADAV
jgi:4-amino-4-deoxy-L-arabinose transferase-like glycosyltransferase